MKNTYKKEGLRMENVLVNFDNIIEETDENIKIEKYQKMLV